MPDGQVASANLNYAGAANAALERILREQPSAILYGEDVALPGGVFGVTRGLQRLFGDRVFDTPISESAMLGAALGAATFGGRPIVEIMWADFMLVGIDQIINQMANARYLSRGRIAPAITIRTQQGSQPGACAQHSQSLEALLTHIPGIRVCMPSSPQDAYDLLLTAAELDDPVVVIENRNLYHGAKEAVALGGPVAPPGRARIVRAGWDLTLLSWGATVHVAVDAADQLADQGVSAEVIDARWLSPFDWETLYASLERTGRLAVVHEANVTGGFGAEVLARVAENGPALRGRPLRIGAPDVRIPAAPTLVGALMPSAESITSRVLERVQAAR
jgi:pyruvate/2-oxoglutarate/acetoin dehydrogenase E1 component